MANAQFGKYRLLAELGQGGMADVFLAVAAGPVGSGFSKLGVVKRLRRGLAEDFDFVSMLVDEARIAARLNHPNVVQTNEVGQEEGQYFIAMEYLDGQPLHRIQYRLAREPQAAALFPKELQYLAVADALAGLHHAHELRDYDGSALEIVHRDVTPHNIFITYDGQVKVVDFGIAKAVGRASETRQGTFKGKVRYMAPEQAVGDAVDRRADIYTAGIILWEIATGQRMWRDLDDVRIVKALVGNQVPVSPRSVNPSVPEELDRIIQRALASRPQDRYPTAEDFRVDLEEFLARTDALVQARRNLGAALTKLFHDKRSEIQGIIEQQLSSLSAKSSTDIRSAFVRLDPTGLTPPGGTRSDEVSVPSTPMTSASSTNVAVTTTSSAALPAPNARRSIKFAIAAVIVATALGGWAFVRRFKVPPVASQTTIQAAAPAVSAAPAPSATTVMLSVTVQPANATVTLDDRPLASRHRGAVPRDEHDHRIEIKADGHVTKAMIIRFDADVRLDVTLEALPKTSAPAAPPPVVWVAAPRTQTPAKASSPSAASPPTADEPPPVAAASPAPPPPAVATGKRKANLDKSDPW